MVDVIKIRSNYFDKYSTLMEIENTVVFSIHKSIEITQLILKVFRGKAARVCK